MHRAWRPRIRIPLLVLLLAPWGAAADGSPADRVRTRAEAAGASPAAVAQVLDEVKAAEARGLPAGPIADKYLEGLAKGVPPTRLLAAVRTTRNRLERARDLLAEAGAAGARGEPRAPLIESLAGALTDGAPPEAVQAFGQAAGRQGAPLDHVVTGAATLVRVRGMGVYDPRWVDALAGVVARSRRPEDVARVADDLHRHLRGGGDAELFLTRLHEAGPHGERHGLREGGEGEAAMRGRMPHEMEGAAESELEGREGLGTHEGEAPHREVYDRDRKGGADAYRPGHGEGGPGGHE